VQATALACILTELELIFIREEERRMGTGRYGGIWDYIPLKKIRSTILKEKDIDLLSLSVELPDVASLEYVFQAGVKEEIYRMLEQFGGID
jgi:hypothetical protein